MAPLGQAAAGRKNLAKFLGIDMRAGTTGILTMMILAMMVMMRLRIMVMLPKITIPLAAIGNDYDEADDYDDITMMTMTMTMMMMLAAKGDQEEGVLLDC